MRLRSHPKLRDKWPPAPQSTGFGSNKSPVGAHDVLQWVSVRRSSSEWPANIALNTNYNSRNYVRDLFLEDREFAERLASRLEENVGHTIDEIGEIDLQF